MRKRNLGAIINEVVRKYHRLNVLYSSVRTDREFEVVSYKDALLFNLFKVVRYENNNDVSLYTAVAMAADVDFTPIGCITIGDEQEIIDFICRLLGEHENG